MVASRNGPEGLKASLALSVLMLLLASNEVADQDLAALIAPPVVDRTQKAAFASPFGTIHAANFVMPRPVGASIPPRLGYTLVGLDPNDADITGSIRERILGEAALSVARYAGPVIDRSGKGDYGVTQKDDRRVALKGDRLQPEAVADDEQQPLPQVAQRETPAGEPLSLAPPAPGAQVQEPVEEPVEQPAGYALASTGDYRGAREGGKGADVDGDRAVTSLAFASADVAPALRAARLYFGADPMGQKLGAMEPWAPGQEPRFEDAEVAVNPDARPATAGSEANIKLAALPSQAWSPDQRGERLDVPVERADLPPLPSDPSGVSRGGQTVAPKGQVTGADQRPMTPAERLGLDEKGRAKAEKCLTEVIYFEARGEVVRGQMAVAQVVLNRAFSGKYPNTVCGVVYQNSHRHLACQFTFSCDGIPDVVREPDMWERAKVIASEMLDGKLWLPEVGKATHYHAYWVRPGWVREMTKMHKLGVHTFYRPRAWGDGGEAPEWGDPASTQESAKKLVEAAKKL
jgi:spore germination cell wall hydrolase CwlJ-like protein